jgi:hypothetical protein
MLAAEMFDFFISHNRAEKAWVRKLVGEFEQRGVKYFFDEQSISFGEDIVSAITTALHSAKHVILVLSRASVHSRWVELEWATTVNEDPDAQARRLIPILLEECEIPIVIRRLKYLDARSLECDAVAEQLLKMLPTGTEESAISISSLKRSVVVGRPLYAPSSQYIQRAADRRIASIIDDASHSVGVFGPRMIGKTSLLFRARAHADLQGKLTAFFDCQMAVNSTGEDFIAALIRTICKESGINYQIHPKEWLLSDEALDELAHRKDRLILLIDEFDLIQSVKGFSRVLAHLRYMANASNVQIICAGVLPPHRWESDPEGSPFWNISETVFLSSFSRQEAGAVLQRYFDAETYKPAEVESLYELTGGHPWLIAQICSLAEQGYRLEHVLEDPLDTTLGLRLAAEVSLQTARYILKDQAAQALLAVARGESINDRDLREGLWVAGVIRNSREQPPRPASGLLKQLLEDRDFQMRLNNQVSRIDRSNGDNIRH